MHAQGRGSPFLSILAALVLSPAALAQDKWGAHLDFEAKPGTKRNLGEADLFAPLWQDHRTLLFGSLRGRFDDESSREGNLGLGVRRMVESGWNLGGYGYFDRRKTESGNYFSQATFGAEALGRDWDFRANAYLPTGTKVRETGTADTASISGASVVVSSVTSDERALKGYDAEVGWRVPFFDAEAAKQLRVYAGGYRFKDEAVKVEGPRVRAEFTMAELSGLWSGAQLMVSAEAQDDDVRGSQSFVGLRLRVPLGGKAEPRKLNWQERRMTAPVVRDVDIVAAVVARPAVVETASVTADGQALTVLSSAGTNGAAFQTALATAGPNSTVVLTGDFTTTTPTTLQVGQTVAGGGVQVRTPSGRVAALPPTGAAWTGNVSGTNYTVVMANSSTLQGMTINNTDSSGNNALAVGVNGVSNVRVIDNAINATASGGSTAHGIDVTGGASNVTISGNRFNVVNTGNSLAIGIQVLNSSAAVSGNTVSVAASGSLSTGVLLNAATNTTVSSNSITISGTQAGGGARAFEVSGATSATISGNTGSVTNARTVSGLAFNNTTSALTTAGAANLTFTGNTFTVSNSGTKTDAGAQAVTVIANGMSLGGSGTISTSGNSLTVSAAASSAGSGATTVTANGLDVTSGTVTFSSNTASATASGTNTGGGALTVTGNAARLTNATINAGSTGNVNNGGVCANGGGNTGSISFTNGTTCP